jgi:hypothetical protein
MGTSGFDFDTSVVRAYWPEPEAPMEEEVRLGFLRAFPEAEPVDELEADDDILFGLVFRMPEEGGEVVLTAEPKPEIDDDVVEASIVDPEERAAVARSKFCIAVERPCGSPKPVEAYLEQIRMAEAACVPGFPALYDDNAARLRSGADVRALTASVAPPRADELYCVHVVEGRRGAWVHSHGLSRLGIPELELWGVDVSDVDAAEDLVRAVVDAWRAGTEPDENETIRLAPDAAVRLRPVDAGLARAPADLVAARREHAPDEGDVDHDGPRRVIFAADRDETPVELFDRAAIGAAYFKASSEADRRSRLATERFGVFGQLFAMRRKDGWRFQTQIACDGGPGGGREHLWFEALELRPGFVRGARLSEPSNAAVKAASNDGWFPLSRMSDWLVISPDGAFGPEHATRLLGDD